MIDIKNGYIVNDQSELRQLWFDEAIKQGYGSYAANHPISWYNYTYCIVVEKRMTTARKECPLGNRTQLTLEDFKQEKGMKHPHTEEIIKLVNNWDTYVVMYKQEKACKWVHLRFNGMPTFVERHQYQTIPKQHVECFLAYHNEGKEIECERFSWELVSNPEWVAGTNYRIKPDEPELIKWEHSLAGILLHVGKKYTTDGVEINTERGIAEYYFGSGVYLKRSPVEV